MSIAVNDLSGNTKEGNTYYEDIHKSVDAFDFVMANSASDARGTELEIRIQLIESNAVEEILVPSLVLKYVSSKNMNYFCNSFLRHSGHPCPILVHFLLINI